MTILVDPPQAYPRMRGLWSHMMSDLMEPVAALDELHSFATRLGLKREWFQGHNPRYPHYDITASRRTVAVKLGAKSVASRDLVLIARSRFDQWFNDTAALIAVGCTWGDPHLIDHLEIADVLPFYAQPLTPAYAAIAYLNAYCHRYFDKAYEPTIYLLEVSLSENKV